MPINPCRNFKNTGHCPFGKSCKFDHCIESPLLDPPKWIFSAVAKDMIEFSPEEIRAYFYQARNENRIEEFIKEHDKMWLSNYNTLCVHLNNIENDNLVVSDSERSIDCRRDPLVFNRPFEWERIIEEINLQRRKEKESLEDKKDGFVNKERGFYKPKDHFYREKEHGDFRGRRDGSFHKERDFYNKEKEFVHKDNYYQKGYHSDRGEFYNDQKGRGYKNEEYNRGFINKERRSEGYKNYDRRSYDDRNKFEDRRNYDDRNKFDDKRNYDDRNKFDSRRNYGDRNRGFQDRKFYDDRKNYYQKDVTKQRQDSHLNKFSDRNNEYTDKIERKKSMHEVKYDKYGNVIEKKNLDDFFEEEKRDFFKK